MDIKELSQISGPQEEHWDYAAKFDLLASTVGQFGAQLVAGSGLRAPVARTHALP